MFGGDYLSASDARRDFGCAGDSNSEQLDVTMDTG
jgi:hypothetical protein